MADDVFHNGSSDLTSDLPGGALLPLQGISTLPQNSNLGSATGMLVPDVRTDKRFDNFPDDLYDLSPNSHLVRFLKAMTGDAGSGQVRKRSLVARLQSVLTSTHFYDLDGFYGAIFGAVRAPSETLPTDPMVTVATPDEWDDVSASDSSYRARIEALARAIALGGTRPGLIAAAEAISGVECDLFETWSLIDLYGSATQSGRTWDQIWNPIAVTGAFPTWNAIEGIPWNSVMNAIAIGRSNTNSRNEVVIKPLREFEPDTAGVREMLLEEISLLRVLQVLKPAGVLLTVDNSGVGLHQPTLISNIKSDSDYWEIITKVVPRPDLMGRQANPYPVSDIYATLNGPTAMPPTPRPLPVPPLSASQGDEWYHNGGVVTVSSYAMVVPSTYDLTQPGTGAISAIPDYERVVKQDGSETDFVASKGVADPRTVLAARASNDGTLVAHPYSGARVQVVPQ